MQTHLDHLVIAAHSLEQGINYVETVLGVTVPFGGEHLLMGTHNHLMQLGNEVFLEVIATNPTAPAPKRPRWYGLDDPFIARQLTQAPQLLTWVVNTTDMQQLQRQTNFVFGEPTSVSRGDLKWQFGIPEDGRVLAGGALPYMIQWQSDSHPANHMANLGCHLHALEIYHPYPEWLQSVLANINALEFVDIKQLDVNKTTYLVAHIDTPTGIKTLGGNLLDQLI